MKGPLLSSTIIVFLIVAVVVSSDHVPAEKYWKQVLPNTPIPKAIKDSLDTGETGSAGVVVGKGGTKVNVNGPKSKTRVVVGKGGTIVTVKPGPKNFLYKYAATDTQLHDDPNTALFFLEKDLITPIGKPLSLHFTSAGPTTTFLTCQVEDSTPFGSKKMPEILARLGVAPGSAEAGVMKTTVKECEDTPMKGEDKKCVASLESMVDYATSKIGTRVSVVSTEGGNDKEEKYKIVKAKRLGQRKDMRAVVCHKQSYPYAVFYCHETSTTRVYGVSLEGVGGADVKAVAVCHTDTSEWNPKHLAFRVLKVRPGSVPVCHFLPEDHVVWVPK